MNVPRATNCRRCAAAFTATNTPLTESDYGCTRCRGKRPELTKTLGQEDEVGDYLRSKVDAG